MKPLNVRITANFEDRVRRIMEKKDQYRHESEAEVQEQDLRKQGFIRRYFNKNTDDPESYHLILNTSYVPAPCAVEQIVSLYRALAGTGEQTVETGP